MAFLGIRIAVTSKQEISKEKKRRKGEGIEKLALASLLDKGSTVL